LIVIRAMEMVSPPIESLDDLDDLRRVLAEVGHLQDEVVDLQLGISVRDAKILEQAQEIAQLKGLPPRPKFKGKPSGIRWTRRVLFAWFWRGRRRLRC
jgi:hypothetical protein